MNALIMTPPLSRRLLRRIVQLYAGLYLYGAGIALQVESGLGLDPWDVFHQGLAERTGLTIGLCVNIVGLAVLLLWIPLRQRPGLGTISNVLLVGTSVDLTAHLVPTIDHWAGRWAYLLGGILCIAIATGMYIGAGLGPGPRDGLMTGLAKRGWSIRLARTMIELAVLATGWLLGGTVGIGTVLFAATIGPLAQAFMPLFAVGRRPDVPSNAA